MPRTTVTLLAMLAVVAAACAAGAAGRDADYTPAEADLLAVRAAQVDAVHRLTELVRATALPSGTTVGEALVPGSRQEIALRVFLRSARMVGPPRVYSDGVAEVDVHAPLEVVIEKTAALCSVEVEGPALAGLRRQAVDGHLCTTGRGRAPPGLATEAIKRLRSAPPEALPEMFPAGWRRVTATGRVLAIRAARIAAYEAMADRLNEILLAQTESVGTLVGTSPAAQAAFEAYVRSLAVSGPPRLMPDRIAEVDVTAPLPGLIEALKDIRRLRGGQVRVTEDQLDRLSVRIKSDGVTVTGRGMPPPDTVRPAPAPAVAGGEALPDWATEVFEAAGTARLNPEMDDPAKAALLASRSAKVRALDDLERQVDRIALADGQTVRQRAARDATFRRDLGLFLESARVARSRAIDDGRGREVVLRLPLLRLYEFSRE
jgi:hypothetical protein